MNSKGNEYRGTEQEKRFAMDMMYGWLIGWPEYIQEPKDDWPAITSIAKKAAKVAQVSLDEEEGYMKIKNGLAQIAAFCRDSLEWKVRNLHYIDNGLQNVLLQMSAYKKSKEAQREKLKEVEKIDFAQTEKRRQEEKLHRQGKKEALIYCINKQDYIWEYSQIRYNETNKLVVLKYDEAKKILEEKPVEFIEELKRNLEVKRDRWKQILKEWVD